MTLAKIIKRSVTLILLLVSSLTLFAQKEVRRDIKKGNKSYEQSLFNAAEADYKSALEKNASSPEAIYNLANTYYQQGNWDEALKSYQQYLTIENKDAKNMSSAWHNMGNLMLRKKDLNKSMAAYKQALRLNPTDDETRYNLAVVQKMIQDQQNDDQNQDQQQDQDQKDQDKNKDQNQDQNKDKQDQDQDKNKDQNKDQNQDQQDQMSQESIQQLLQAIEQDEKGTQDKVQQMKAAERKKQNENNRRQNKDW